MGALPHLLYSQRSKETQNNTLLKKMNWEQNSHSYRVVHEKYITYIHTYKTGLDQLVKGWSSINMNEVNVT